MSVLHADTDEMNRPSRLKSQRSVWVHSVLLKAQFPSVLEGRPRARTSWNFFFLLHFFLLLLSLHFLCEEKILLCLVQSTNKIWNFLAFLFFFSCLNLLPWESVRWECENLGTFIPFSIHLLASASSCISVVSISPPPPLCPLNVRSWLKDDSEK